MLVCFQTGRLQVEIDDENCAPPFAELSGDIDEGHSPADAAFERIEGDNVQASPHLVPAQISRKEFKGRLFLPHAARDFRKAFCFHAIDLSRSELSREQSAG